MRRILKVAAFIMSAAFIMLVFACPQKAEPNGPKEPKPTGPVAVTGVSLNTESLTLPVGTTARLTATVAPSNATEKRVTWASNNETVATVVNGTVTAKALGTATVTVTTLDGSKTATCSVTVTNHPLTSISVSPTQTSYTVGDNFYKSHITVTANYSDGSSQEVTDYTTSPTAFDTVGTTTVTVSYTENDITKTTNYDVTVNPKPIPVESVSLDQTTLSLTLDGTTATLVATISPSDATNKAVTWESSNPLVATVADGTVTAIAVGTATITVKTEDGEKTATCNVTVTNPLTSISVAPKKTVYTIGDNFDKSHITVTAHYSDGSSQEVTNYTASPTTFNTIGSTTVTVSYTEDGITKTANYNVTVTNPLTSISVSPKKTSYTIGESFDKTDITVTATYSDGSSHEVTDYTTSPTTFDTLGSITVTVSYTEDGITKDTNYNVAVEPVRVTSVSISTKPGVINLGSTRQFQVDVQPSNATNKTVTWSTSDPSIATVTDGLVEIKTTQKDQSCTITVTTEDGNKTDSFTFKTYERDLKMTEIKSGGKTFNIGTGTNKVKFTKNFWISDHELTQIEWLEVFDINPSKFQSAPAEGEIQELRPVESVNWYMAIAYCNKLSLIDGLTPCYTVRGVTDWANLKFSDIPTSSNNIWIVTCDFSKTGYRLPTEAEWEYAARGGLTGDVYAGTTNKGNDLRDYAWYSNCGNKTHEVKTKRPNAYGLYDMSGNVNEWCWDRYGSYESYAIDPVGPDRGREERVYRGGCYYYDASSCRVSDRNPYGWAANGSDTLGFRLARTVTE